MPSRAHRDRAFADITDVADHDTDDERIEVVGGEPHHLYRKIARELESARSTRVDVRHVSHYLQSHRSYSSPIPPAPSGAHNGARAK